MKKNRAIFLAVPDWTTVHNLGGDTFTVSVFEWDFGSYDLVHQNGEILIPARRRGERKVLREILVHSYGFPYVRTVVV